MLNSKTTCEITLVRKEKHGDLFLLHNTRIAVRTGFPTREFEFENGDPAYRSNISFTLED